MAVEMKISILFALFVIGAWANHLPLNADSDVTTPLPPTSNATQEEETTRLLSRQVRQMFSPKNRNQVKNTVYSVGAAAVQYLSGKIFKYLFIKL